MQQGFFLLWLLAVALSFLAWVYVEFSLRRNGRFLNRRQMTGCELTRQVLDRNHLSRIAVNPVQHKKRTHFSIPLDQLLLSERVYYGTRLSDLAFGLHETAHLLEGPKTTVALPLRAKGGQVLQGAILISWILVFGGILFSSQGMSFWGWLLYVSATSLAFLSLSEEKEVTQRAISDLISLDGFGADEKVRLQRLLKAIRWWVLGEIFEAPFSIFPQSKEKINSRVS